MNAIRSSSDVVLRNARFQAGTARVGRLHAEQETTAPPADSSDGRPPGKEAAARPSTHEDALRHGIDEGLRQGRAEGLRTGAEEGRRAGYEEGIAGAREAAQLEGRKALEVALAEAMRPVQEKSRALDALATALQTQVAACLSAVEEELVALCFEVLTRVLGQTIITPAGLQAQVGHLLAAGGRAVEVAVHLHPQDAQLLQEACTKGGSVRFLRYVADDRVAIGGCMLRGGGPGDLDARLETILQQCKDALIESRTSRLPVRGAQATPEGGA